MEQVDDWLERLIEEKGDDLYRMKGVLSVTGSDQRYIFQVFPQLFMLYLLTNYTSRFFADPNWIFSSCFFPSNPHLLPWCFSFRGCILYWMVAQAKHGDLMRRE
jgi:hypothetical protein